MEITEDFLNSIDLSEGVKNFLLLGHDRQLSFDSMEMLELQEGFVKMRLRVDEETCNPYGVVHGGAIFTLCDTVAALTAITTGEKVVTLSNSMNFIRAARDGYIYASPKILHRGRTTMVMEVIVTDDFDKLIAKGTFTLYSVGNMSEYEDVKNNG